MNPRLHLRKCIYGLVLFATVVYLILVIIKFCCIDNMNRTNVRWRLTDEGSKNEIELHSTHNTNNRTVVEENLLTCPVPPPFLRGHLEVVDVNLTSLNLNLSTYYGGEVERGGIWRPKDCDPRKKVAVMIPFRNRWEQLNTFLNHMHPVFQRQQLDYRIFVIEQAGRDMFNKGAIYNIGFNESLQYDDYDCYVFHDVDLLSETDTNYYGCPNSPMHLSVGIDKFDYKLSYKELIGGIQLFSKQHYIMVNGYSNQFWGWGGEDDNLYTRIKAKGLKLVRPAVDVARYKMNQNYHFRSDGWSKANQVLIYNRRPRQDIDGLNSITKLNFTLKTIDTLLFTLISINLHRK